MREEAGKGEKRVCHMLAPQTAARLGKEFGFQSMELISRVAGAVHHASGRKPAGSSA